MPAERPRPSPPAPDFLPLKCDACQQIFCTDHVAYAQHACTSAYKKVSAKRRGRPSFPDPPPQKKTTRGTPGEGCAGPCPAPSWDEPAGRGHLSPQSFVPPTPFSPRPQDVQVPVCPLCNTPVPVRRGEMPDVLVGEHIDRHCKADPAQRQRKVRVPGQENPPPTALWGEFGAGGALRGQRGAGGRAGWVWEQPWCCSMRTASLVLEDRSVGAP